MDGTAAGGTTPPSAEVLSGVVERVTVHNPETGFCVLRVKARGYKDLVTVVCHAAAIEAGQSVSASGAWVNDRTHGLQLRIGVLKTTAPTTLKGIERYLGSGMSRGITGGGNGHSRNGRSWTAPLPPRPSLPCWQLFSRASA